MENINEKIHKYIYNNENEMISFLSKLIAYPSTQGERLDGKPFGEECAKVLDEFLRKAEGIGFKTKNLENYAGHADMNDLKPEIGILCHLDVVPAGTNWSSDPFKAEVHDGKIFGRGAIDDKGPAVAALFAMKCVHELNIPLKKGVRIIVGCNEENGSEDMEYYTKHEKFPPKLVTPDGNYPVINIEKGMLRCKISAETLHDDIIYIKGGNVINAVPEYCEAVIKGKTVSEVLRQASSINYGKFDVYENGDSIKIEAHGKCEHASTPERGINAVTAMLYLLSKIYGGKVKMLSDIFKAGETSGESAKISCSDKESGSLTLVLSVIDYEDSTFTAYADSRFPVSKTLNEISEALIKTLNESGFKGEIILGSEPHYVDSESDFVKALLSVYEDVTGEKGECIAIGGGTYVHDTKSGVAFGAEFPGEDNHMHGADEFIKIKSLLTNAEIYARMIVKLAG